MSYSHKQAESKWQAFWRETGVFRFKPDSGRPVFSIDTPPPTVSGSLHIGHVFSYTQTEVMARYFRLRGYEVYYPFGFDNNGLPTEILTEREHGVRADALDRAEFQALCAATSATYIAQFRDLWQRLGFSCDWDEAYCTNDDRCRRISQRAFLDLYRAGRAYRREEPVLWCTECGTAFSQAEVDAVPTAGRFYTVEFHTTDGRRVPVATTRPELLPACVAVFVHPGDSRHSGLIGCQALVPLCGHEVPILADEEADPDKGTGAVMCCTFGDTADIAWWRRYSLPLRTAITGAGDMTALAGRFEGLSVKEARAGIAQSLRDAGHILREADLGGEQHVINTHERCGTEVEYLVREQWFIDVLHHKDAIIASGASVNWYPEHMRSRFTNWVESLAWDWCISRQRPFGVPIPVWYCGGCGAVIPADEEQLPVDPVAALPPVSRCPDCGTSAFIPERDVLDTWATSSLTPQINARWHECDDRSELLFPMSMRAQAHDIIRTWAFATITRSLYHASSIPWHDAVISGHAVKRGSERVTDGQTAGRTYARKSKISKSKDTGGEFAPERLLDTYGADALRYWTCGANLGADIVFDEGEVRDARKVVTKLWNAGRYTIGTLSAFGYTGAAPVQRSERPVDAWLRTQLATALQQYHRHFARYEFHGARLTVLDFFRHDFCDNYLEFTKGRFRDEQRPATREEQNAAAGILYEGMLRVLQMFAPFVPHIAEELYQSFFRQFEREPSVHVTRFPELDPRRQPAAGQVLLAGELLIDVAALLRGYKTDRGLSLRTPLAKVGIICDPVVADALALTEDDLCRFGHIAAVDYASDAAELAARDPGYEEYGPQRRGVALAVKPDEQALAMAGLIKQLRATGEELKAARGLSASSRLAEVVVACRDAALLFRLKERQNDIARALRASAVVFREDVEGMTPVSGTLEAAIEIVVE